MVALKANPAAWVWRVSYAAAVGYRMLFPSSVSVRERQACRKITKKALRVV